MTPTIGRIVHLFPGENSTHLQANGLGPTDPVPAVITRVWSDDCINVRCLLDSTDGDGAPCVISVVRRTDNSHPGNVSWDWPPRS